MISKELLSEVLNIENERISRTVDKFCFPNTNTIAVQYYMTDGWQHINIYELAFRTREYLKTKSKHLSLNQSIDDIFKEANDIYESLSK